MFLSASEKTHPRKSNKIISQYQQTATDFAVTRLTIPISKKQEERLRGEAEAGEKEIVGSGGGQAFLAAEVGEIDSGRAQRRNQGIPTEIRARGKQSGAEAFKSF